MRASFLTTARLQFFKASCILIVFGCIPASGQVPLPGAIDRFDTILTLDQDVVVSVGEISTISVSGDVTLTFVSYSSGANLDDVVNSSTSYDITVNGASKKISASLDSDYSTGIALSLLLGAPGSGTASEITLSTTPQDVVVGFGKTAATALSITYTATASITVPPNGAGESRTITLTLSDN